MSSIALASSFFSLAFFSCSVRSRLVSFTSRQPNLASHLRNVASPTSGRRQACALTAPACCSIKILMICSSLNLARMIGPFLAQTG
jgi:hypothetical protein